MEHEPCMHACMGDKDVCGHQLSTPIIPRTHCMNTWGTKYQAPCKLVRVSEEWHEPCIGVKMESPMSEGGSHQTQASNSNQRKLHKRKASLHTTTTTKEGYYSREGTHSS